MKNFRIAFLVIFAFVGYGLRAQTLNLTLYGNGPINGNICADLGKLTATAYFPTNQFETGQWRYRFEWFINGSSVHTETQTFVSFPLNKVSHLTNSQTPMITGVYTVKFTLYKLFANGTTQLITSGSETVNQEFNPSISWLDASSIKGTVAGDFDMDHFEDDIVAFSSALNAPSTSILYGWTSDGNKMTLDNDNGWWSANWYDPNKIEGRVVALDFDNDGFKNDLVAFQNVGPNTTSIDLWSSQKNTNGVVSLLYHGSKWQSSSYNANNITNRVVSGDFDSDTWHDDIAVIYDYGSSRSMIHLFIGDQNTFTYQAGWDSGPGMFNANAVTGLVVSGDFDHDTYHNDIIALYDYSNATTKAFMFKDVDNPSHYETWWTSTTYGAGNTKGNLVAADFDNDGIYDDISAVYDYGNSASSVHSWRGESSSLTGVWTNYVIPSPHFNSLNIRYRTVTGDFDNDGKIDDVNSLYHYGGGHTAIFQWEDIKPENTASLVKTWETCFAPQARKNESSLTSIDIEEENKLEFNLYPNPASNKVFIQLQDAANAIIDIFDLQGKKLITQNITQNDSEIDISKLPQGIYLINITNNGKVDTKKLIVE